MECPSCHYEIDLGNIEIQADCHDGINIEISVRCIECGTELVAEVDSADLMEV